MLVCDFGNMEFTNAQPDKIGRTPKSVPSFTLKPASTTGSPEPAWAAHKTIRTGKKRSPSQPELTIDFLPPFEVDLQHDKLEAPTLTAWPQHAVPFPTDESSFPRRTNLIEPIESCRMAAHALWFQNTLGTAHLENMSRKPLLRNILRAGYLNQAFGGQRTDLNRLRLNRRNALSNSKTVVGLYPHSVGSQTTARPVFNSAVLRRFPPVFREVAH